MKLRAENITEESGQTDAQEWIPSNRIVYNTGTWADVIASGVVSKSRTAADANTGFAIPINPPGNRTATSRGVKVTSVTVYYTVGTADLTDWPASGITMVKVTAANGTAAATAAAGGTLTLSLTTTSRKGTGSPALTVTPGTPAFIGDGECWWLLIDAIDAATTSVLTVQGAVINYTRAL